MRREAPAVAAVIVAVWAVLAPLTLGGRLASSADLDAFYAPVRDASCTTGSQRGDLPFWAPGAFSGQPFLADAQSGVTYPPMLLASWLLGPIDALRAVATFHYLIAALGTYALARQLRASRTGSAFGAIAFAASGHLVARSAALGLLGGAAWLAPALALAEAAASARPARRGLRDRRARGGARAAPGQRLAAARRAHAGDLRDLADRARGRARGCAYAAVAIVLRARARGAWRCCRGSSCCALATASGYVDPDGIGSLLFGDRRGARRALRRLALGDRDALPRRRHAGARADRLAARLARRRAGAAARLA